MHGDMHALIATIARLPKEGLSDGSHAIFLKTMFDTGALRAVSHVEPTFTLEVYAMKGKLRWYDAYNRLSLLFEGLKDVCADRRNTLISGMMSIIEESSPDLLDKFVEEFPLDDNRRRWYDNNPNLWLIVNGLKFAEKDLLDSVVDFLTENMAHKAEKRRPERASLQKA
jgi:hypothetical protein